MLGKKATRRDDHKKKARPTKAMALSARDAVKRLPLKMPITKERSNLLIKVEHPKKPSGGKTSTPVKKPVTSGPGGADEPAPIVAAIAENALPSMFTSQMQLFATLLKWSPLTMMVRQQALVTDMMFSLRYPKKSELP